jgi:hypothetical protein
MYVSVGRPRRLSDVAREVDIQVLKKSAQVAVVDDEPFNHAEALRLNGFQIVEVGADVRTIEQFENYGLIVCDIRGVGKALGSRFEGAHVIKELRKRYPDKYLVAFTGMTFDASYNDCLNAADVSVKKDAGFDPWVSLLENGLREVSNPRTRWLRFRAHLSKAGLDAYQIFRMEQAYIKAVEKKNPEIFASELVSVDVGEDVKKILGIFSKVTLPVLAALG